MYVHGIAEIADDPLGAQAAGLVLVRIASLAVQQLLVANGHAPSANPIVAVPGMNMIEICQRGSPRGYTLTEYQIACERDPQAAKLEFPPKGA